MSPEKQRVSSDSDDCSDIMTPTGTKPTDFLLKSHAVIQRRHTICGGCIHNGDKSNMIFWHDLRHGSAMAESPSLRDKSVSFGFGLDTTPRPTTCLGISGSSASKSNEGKTPITTNPTSHLAVPPIVAPISSSDEDEERRRSKPSVSKVVRFDSSQELKDYKDSEYTCNVQNTVLELYDPLPFVDDDEVMTESNVLQEVGRLAIDMEIDEPPTQAVNDVLVRREIAKWEQKVAANEVVKKIQPKEVLSGMNSFSIPICNKQIVYLFIFLRNFVDITF